MDPVTDDLQQMYLKFLDDPSWATHVCVPAAYVEWGQPCVLEDALALGATVVDAKLGERGIKAYLFPLTDDKKEALLRVMDRVSPDLQMHGDILAMPVLVIMENGPQMVPLLLPEKGDVVHVQEYAGQHKKTDKMAEVCFTFFRQLAERVASLANCRLFLHFNGPRMASPRRTEGRDIHVFVGIAPTGEEVNREITRVLGHDVAAKGGAVIAYGPTPGRGRVLKDGEGEPLVQIVDGNWFLLAPVATYVHRGSAKLFEALLMEAWAFSLEAPVHADPAQRSDKDAFIRGLAEMRQDGPNQLEEQLVKADELIRVGLEEIAKIRRQRAHVKLCLDAYRATAQLVDMAMQMTADYKALEAMPEIEAFWVDGDAFMVRTRMLTCMHEDRRYAVGSYGIRVSVTAVVSVWCETPAHAGGIPHPHMPRDMSPCFGNAGDAISEAAAEFRFADVVRYVIDWLTAGYSPDTTLVLIEEWPFADADGNPLPDETVTVRPVDGPPPALVAALLASDAAPVATEATAEEEATHAAP